MKPKKDTSEMHPSLWTASSTNTIKRDSFKSKSSSSGLNSLYATFNIQEPSRNRSKENGGAAEKTKPVFTMDSLFPSSQNTLLDVSSVGTDVSAISSDWGGSSRRADHFGRHSSERSRRKSESVHRFGSTSSGGGYGGRRSLHHSYKISSNSQTIHSTNNIKRDYPTIAINARTGGSGGRHGIISASESVNSIGPEVTSMSLPKLQGDYESESIPEENVDEDFPYDLRMSGSTSFDSRKRTFDNMSISTTYSSGAFGSYVSAQYSRKWRVIIALLVGGLLIALCVLGFYLNAESRKAEYKAAVETVDDLEDLSSDESLLEGVGPVREDPVIVPPLSAPPKSVESEADIKRIAEWRVQDDSCDYLEWSCPAGYKSPVVLLVAIDGVRSDMINETSAPALHHLSKCGVSADHLTPVYPSSTLPNLYTIVTGLYPESHGIIGAEMHDPERNKTFRAGKYESYKPYWWKGEPVWNTIKKKGLKSAMYFWPGSDVQDGSSYPTYSYKYRNEYPLDTRVNKILEWLLFEEEERPSLLGLYFDYPNKVAKDAGPFSKKAFASLLEVDHQIDRLMTEIHNKNLSSCVDVIVVSDHGTATATCGGSLYLENFVADIKEKARVVSGAVGRLQAINGKATNQEIINQLRCKNPKLRALSKELLPTRYHYGNNKLIEGVILDTLPGNRIVTNNTKYCSKAEHGFNNIESSMQGMFIARGPSFKTNMKTSGFRSVELYNLLCRLLEVDPAPNNGTEGSLFHILSSPPPPPPVTIDPWPENVVRFLHARARDDSFKEEIKMGIAASTPSPTTNAISSPQTPTTPIAVPSTTAVTPSSEATTPSTTASSVAVTASTAPSTTLPSSTSASTSSTTSASPVSNPPSAPTDPQLSPDLSSTPLASVVSTTSQPVVTQPSSPATQASEVDTSSNRVSDTVVVAGQREGKMANDDAEKPLESNIPRSTVASIEAPVSSTTAKLSQIQESSKVIVKIDEMSNSSMASSDDLPSHEDRDSTNSVSVVPKVETSAVDDSTQVTGDVVETATTGSISISMEAKDPILDPPITTTSPVVSTTQEASSTMTSEKPVEIPSPASTTVTPAVSEAPVVLESPAASAAPVPADAQDSVPTASPSTTTTSVVPSATAPATVGNQEAHSSQTDESNVQDSSDSTNSTHESTPSSKRKKRQACDCASTEVLQSEAGRGKVAGKGHISFHCPFGVPHYSSPDAPKGTHYILPHASHVTGYIGELGTSLWTSFTLTNESLAAVEAERPTVPIGTSGKAEEVREVLPLSICWQADPRLPRDPQQQCLEYLEEDRYSTDTDTIRQLFPEELELREVQARESFFLTNAIALKKSFVSGARTSMMGLIKDWTRLRNVINVVSGPVWDRNLNGRVDTIIHIRSRVEYLIPSHVFYLVSSCNPMSGFDALETDLRQCPIEDLDTMVFIFPNTELNDDCLMSPHDYSLYHLASVIDLQRMTGLQFFSSFDAEPGFPALLAHQPLRLWQD